MAFSREAPPGLSLTPRQELALRAFARQRRENPQSVAISERDSAWWAQRHVDVPPGPLPRKRLFELGQAISDDTSLLTFVWHVLAWGSGASRRHNSSRVNSLRDPVAGSRFSHLTNRASVRSALEASRAGDVRQAYSTLIRKGGGVVPGLGPAFFTKLLYFAGDPADPKCLILDARVAQSLESLGWQMSPQRGHSSFNWYTDTYVSYCDLLSAWAQKASGPVKADSVEEWLFERMPEPSVPAEDQ